jgi:hypothetical protein
MAEPSQTPGLTTFRFDVENHSSLAVWVDSATEGAGGGAAGFEPGQQGTISTLRLNMVGVEVSNAACELLATATYPDPGRFTLLIENGSKAGTIKLSTGPATPPDPIPLPSNAIHCQGG